MRDSFDSVRTIWDRDRDRDLQNLCRDRPGLYPDRPQGRALYREAEDCGVAEVPDAEVE